MILSLKGMPDRDWPYTAPSSALRSSRCWQRVVAMKNITPTADQQPAPPDKAKRISKRVRTALDAGDVQSNPLRLSAALP